MQVSLFRKIQRLLRPYDRCPSLRILLEGFETLGPLIQIAPKNVRLKDLCRDAFQGKGTSDPSMCFKVIKELRSTENLIQEIFPPEELDYLARAHESFDDFYHRILKNSTSSEELSAALAILERGHSKARKKEINSAIRHYETSISLFPTSDAFSYLGLMLVQNSKLTQALDMYHQAIEVDNTFGNPYNDIGVILMNMNRTNDSLEWFERAKWRPRSDARQHPYANLGKIFMSRGDIRSALREFVAGTHFDPKSEALRRATKSCWDTIRRSI